MVMVMEQQNQINNQFLPVHTKLQERYEILKVNGEGNFGITYIGWDCLLESKVAIKEFFPVSRVRRDVSKGETEVYVFQEKEYEQILEKYLEEARKLSKLNQIDGIVSIRDFFYANHTAYIVFRRMEPYQSMKLNKCSNRFLAHCRKSMSRELSTGISVPTIL